MKLIHSVIENTGHDKDGMGECGEEQDSRGECRHRKQQEGRAHAFHTYTLVICTLAHLNTCILPFFVICTLAHLHTTLFCNLHTCTLHASALFYHLHTILSFALSCTRGRESTCLAHYLNSLNLCSILSTLHCLYRLWPTLKSYFVCTLYCLCTEWYLLSYLVRTFHCVHCL